MWQLDRSNGNLAMWQLDRSNGNSTAAMAIWQCGNVAMWQCGNSWQLVATAWQRGSSWQWQCGNALGSSWQWQCGNGNVATPSATRQLGNSATRQLGNVATAWQRGSSWQWQLVAMAMWQRPRQLVAARGNGNLAMATRQRGNGLATWQRQLDRGNYFKVIGFHTSWNLMAHTLPKLLS